MSWVRSILAVVVIVSWVAGCAGALSGGPASNDHLPVREYVGHYTQGTGGSWFVPCPGTDSTPRWWVTLTGRAVEQYSAARADGRAVADTPSFVRIRAAATDERHVGPGGPALLVREVSQLRPAEAGDCGSELRGARTQPSRPHAATR